VSRNCCASGAYAAGQRCSAGVVPRPCREEIGVCSVPPHALVSLGQVLSLRSVLSSLDGIDGEARAARIVCHLM